MNKINLLKLLLTILILGSLSPASASQISAGSPCSKNGATKVVKSVKYLCKKSGKTLTWVNPGAKKTEKQTGITSEKPLEGASDALPAGKSTPLTLRSSIESGTHLRLELSEDIYLGHCASFLVYNWGVADSYEGVFYRQKKEYLIPVNLSSKNDLPLSFTFKCPEYSIQSYAIDWKMSSNSLIPSLTLLKKPIIKTEVKNVMPSNMKIDPLGEIKVGFPDSNEVANSLISLQDGYFASESNIFFSTANRLDSCVAKLLDPSGSDVKTLAYGPGVESTYSDSSLFPTGFDRLHGFGYVSYRGAKEIELRLEISCLASGTFSATYLHPAPVKLLQVVLTGPCPSTYKDQILPALKPSGTNLVCRANSSGVFTWTRIVKVEATPTTTPVPVVALSPQQLTQLKAKIISIQKLGLKARKFQQMLDTSLKESSSRKFSEEKITQLKTLRDQAQEIDSRAQKLNVDTDSRQTNLEISWIVSNFTTLENSYGEAMASN
jgi:hypothetical protein